MQENWVQPLGWEDPLEKGIAIQSSILAQRIPWTKETGRLQPMRLQRVGYDSAKNTSTFKMYKKSQSSIRAQQREKLELRSK